MGQNSFYIMFRLSGLLARTSCLPCSRTSNLSCSAQSNYKFAEFSHFFQTREIKDQAKGRIRKFVQGLKIVDNLGGGLKTSLCP